MPSMSTPISAAYLKSVTDGETRRFPLTGKNILQIGRSETNHVILAGDRASRHHDMLQHSEDGQFYITDLGSSNGTFVNGTRISTPVILRAGDRVGIGNYEFTFHQEADVQPPPVEDPDALKSTNML